MPPIEIGLIRMNSTPDQPSALASVELSTLDGQNAAKINQPPAPAPWMERAAQDTKAWLKQHLDAAILVGELADTDVAYIVDLAEMGFRESFIRHAPQPAPDVAALVERLEASESKLIDERDAREAVIGDLCAAAGHVPDHDFQWTSSYGFAEAVSDVEEKVDALRQRAESAEAAEADLVQEQFWREHEAQTNREFESDYLTIWKAVKKPDMTVLESVLDLKKRCETAELDRDAANLVITELTAVKTSEICAQLDLGKARIAALTSRNAKLREALEMAINTVECDSLDKDGNRLPWYRAAKAALAADAGKENKA